MHYCAEKIGQAKSVLNVLGRFEAGGPKVQPDASGLDGAAAKAINAGKDYEMDYEEFITGFSKMDKRIDLMNTLKAQVKDKKNKNTSHKIDAVHEPF